jgi:hypothetical protein
MQFLEKTIIRNKIIFFFLKHFNSSNLHRDKKETILLEFNSWTFNHVASSYICNILSKKHKAKIAAYPGYQLIQSKMNQNFFQKLYWKLSNLLSLGSFGVYKSFGVKNIFWPKIDNKIKKNVFREFKNYNKKIKSKEKLQNYKIKNILIGDLIYDSYLKKTLYPTIDINSSEFKNFFFDSITLFYFWEDYFSKNKISSIVCFHAVYLGAMPLRFGIKKNIPSYVLNIEKLYCLNKYKIFTNLEYINYKEIFKTFTKKKKNNSLKFTKKKLLKRFNGHLSSELIYVSKNAFGKINHRKVLKDSNKIKILIAPHSYCDSPHVQGNTFFSDNFEWLESLGKISEETDYDWYIKCHPDYTTYFDNTIELIKDYTKRFPNINYLDNKISHNQLIKEGIDYVLTIYGTIAGEYPFFGINAINATKKHSQVNYDFTITPKNKHKYLQLLKNLKKPKKVKKERQVLEHYFMKYEYFNNRWFFNDLNKVKYGIKGFKNFTSFEFYKYWIENFDLKAHKEKYQKIEKFVDSKNYVLVN